MQNPREVPTSLNDDRKPIRLSITDPNPYHIPIAASLASGLMLYASLPDFSKSFEEMSQDIPLLFVATSAVIFCLYFLQWSYADNQAAQDREVPDHFYRIARNAPTFMPGMESAEAAGLLCHPCSLMSHACQSVTPSVIGESSDPS